MGTSTFRVTLAPVDVAWRTNQTVIWVKTSPYYIVGVSTEF